MRRARTDNPLCRSVLCLGLALGLGVGRAGAVSVATQEPPGRGEWSQSRGPNGQGVAPTARIAAQFGPDTNRVISEPEWTRTIR